MTPRQPLAACALACALVGLALALAPARVGSSPAAAPRFDWDTLPALPRPLAGHAAGASHGALLVAGGTDFPTPLFAGGAKVWFDAVHVLERNATSWRTPLRLPHALGYAAAVTVDNRLVIAGGSDGARHYADAFALEWIDGRVRQHPLPPLPTPVAMAGAAVVHRTLVIIGGQTRPDGTEGLRTVWTLDLSSSAPAWQPGPPLPGVGRILPVVIAQGGRIIVISGAALERTATGGVTRRYLTDAYGWTPAATASSAWRRLADVPHPVVAAPGAPIGESHAIVFGGDTGADAARVAELKDRHFGFSRDILAYDTTTDTWTTVGTLPAGLVTTTAVPFDGHIVLPGGEDRPGHRSAAVLRARPATAAPPADTESELRQVDVYVAGQDGYHTYRIPSVILTPQGTLLAFAEARRATAADAGDIDLVVKRSTDGGASWSSMQVIGDNGPNTFGNPCPVIDRTTGRILLLTTHNLGADREKDILAGTSQASRTVWVMHSDDDGVTWSTAEEITRDVKRADWTWYATGPGVGIQTRRGRLVIPANHAEAATQVHRSHIVYSDDSGRSWKLGAISDAGTNESQIVELADGRLLLSMRNHPPKPENFRQVAISTDGGRTLSAVTIDRTLVEPPAQASLLRFTTRQDGGRDRLLFANPASAKRERLTVRVSYDEGVRWPVARVVHDGPSAYSSLVVLRDRSIGVLYERGDRSAYERITFARFTLDWLTNGADRIAAPSGPPRR